MMNLIRFISESNEQNFSNKNFLNARYQFSILLSRTQDAAAAANDGRRRRRRGLVVFRFSRRGQQKGRDEQVRERTANSDNKTHGPRTRKVPLRSIAIKRSRESKKKTYLNR